MRAMFLGSILCGIVVGSTVVAGFTIIARWDTPLSVERRWSAIWAPALLQGIFLQIVFNGGQRFELFLWSLFGGCLLLASITDAALCRVYNFVWWVALVAVGILWWMAALERVENGRNVQEIWLLIQLLGFFLMQFWVFVYTYGGADCYAFCACAVAEASLGLAMESYLCHMILAYLFLFLVQIGKRNVSRKGCLKRPVPFLPYINISFWMNIFVHKFIIMHKML